MGAIPVLVTLLGVVFREILSHAVFGDKLRNVNIDPFPLPLPTSSRGGGHLHFVGGCAALTQQEWHGMEITKTRIPQFMRQRLR